MLLFSEISCRWCRMADVFHIWKCYVIKGYELFTYKVFSFFSSRL
nr:MAG TPA: hypothetical protein [Caudoviricetes sp.]